MRNLNNDVRQENWVLSLKCGIQPSVTHGFVFAYAREKVNTLLSLLSIWLSFYYYYYFNLNIQGFVCLEFVT